MVKQGFDYDIVFKQVQEFGFVEVDLINDVKGKDVVFKMVILSYFVFGIEVVVDELEIVGID